MAPQSCSYGSEGKSTFSLFLMSDLYWPTSSFRSPTVRSRSILIFRFFFKASMVCSKGSCASFDSGLRPMTTSPYMWINRRYESQPKRSLPDLFIIPLTVLSLSPRFRTVSIMPGIDARAPDLTDTSSGLAWSPNRAAMIRSTCFSASLTSSLSPAGYERLFA